MSHTNQVSFMIFFCILLLSYDSRCKISYKSTACNIDLTSLDLLALRSAKVLKKNFSPSGKCSEKLSLA